MESGGLDKIINSLDNISPDLNDDILEDDAPIADHMQSRRELSQKLETDPEYREQYIQQQKVKQQQGLQELIARLNSGKYPSPEPENSKDSQSEESPELSEQLPEPDGTVDAPEHRNSGKQGVYIHKVENVVIHINL